MSMSLHALTAAMLCAPALASEPVTGPDLDQIARDALGLSGGHVSPVAFQPAATHLAAVVEIDGAPQVLRLQESSVRAPGFRVIEIGADGVPVEHDPGPTQTFRGTVAGRGGQVAASLTDEGLFARVSLDGRQWTVEPIAAMVPGAAPSDHVVYLDEDAPLDERSCGTDLMTQPFADFQPQGGQGPTTVAMTGLSVAELGCDADYEYYLDYGSVGAVQNRIEAVINAINSQYESEVAITHQITTIIVRTSSNDPYSSTDAVTLLNQFRNHWNSSQGGVQRDVAQLFTGKEIQGGTIGIAWLSAVCSSYGYGVVQSDFNNAFACSTDLSAHELGHNWGADHCNCTSHTMNPYITCANTFNANFTIPDIVSFRDSVNCLETSGGGDPTSVHVGGLSTDTNNAGKGKKNAVAIVSVVDDQGNAVAGASVTVTFSGHINETASGTTNGSGTATITSVGTKKGKLNFTACVDDVSASLPYAPGDNVATCQ